MMNRTGMSDMKNYRHSSLATQALMLAAALAAASCSADDTSTGNSPQVLTGGQGGGGAGLSGGIAGQTPIAGRAGATAMPGLGTMTMTPPTAGGPSNAGASGAPTGTGIAGGGAATAGAPGSAGQAGGGTAGMAPGGAGAAGGGMAGMAGAAGGGAPPSGTDPMSVCAGGKPGMDSDAAMTRGQANSRNLAIITYLVKAPTKISRFQTTMVVPKPPTTRGTLFIWPGLQHSGGSDPGRVGNGVLQPVLTWGPSCNPKAPGKGNDYMGWWISAMYVNVSTSAAGPGGCAGGQAMDVGVGERLYIDFANKGNEWTQTVVNMANMKKVDFTIDLKGQDQNWAIWDIETPTSSRPIEDTIFEKSVLTFTAPVTSCQPSSAAEVDSFTAPILSTDGLNCCIEKMTLKAKRM